VDQAAVEVMLAVDLDHRQQAGTAQEARIAGTSGPA